MVYIGLIAHIKLQKLFTKNVHTKVKWVLAVSKEKKTRRPIYQRLIDVCIAIYNHLIKWSNWSVLTDLMLFVYIVERLNQTIKWICSRLVKFTASNTQQCDININFLLISIAPKWAQLGGCRLCKTVNGPQVLAGSHIASCASLSRLIPFWSAQLTHVNLYR